MAQPSESSDLQPKRMRGRPFPKGNRANPYGRSGKPRPVPPEPVYDQEPVPEPPLAEGDVPPLEVLRDLRWVYRNFRVRCRGTPQQEALRELLEDDRLYFLDLLDKYEQIHRGRVEGIIGQRGKAAQKAVRDEGTARALGLCDRLLSHLAEEEARGKVKAKSGG